MDDFFDALMGGDFLDAIRKGYTMKRDELEQMTRKDLIALLPPGHGFNPVSSKKAEIIDRLLARKTHEVIELTEREEALVRLATPSSTYGIVLMIERDLFVRWTPLGGGKWRCESNAMEQDEVAEGGADLAWNGQYLVLDSLLFETRGGLSGIVEPYWDNTPLAPFVGTVEE